MYEDAGISIRGSERYEIVLPIRLRLDARSAQRVKIRDGVIPESGFIEGDLIDLSRGGAGIMIPEFLPKGTRLEMRICGLNADPANPLLVSKVRVQRSRMTDSRPAYLVGAAFVEIDAVFEHDLSMLLNRLRADDEDAPPARSAEPDAGKGAA